MKLTFELLGRSINPLRFKTERLAKTGFRERDFDQRLLHFLKLGKYIAVPGTLN